MRILILDENKLFSVALKHFLEASLPGLQAEVVQCYSQGYVRLNAERFALLSMEIGVTKDNGVDFLKRLRAEQPRLPILILSDYSLDYYGPRAIHAGACGFIQKDTEPEQVLVAVTLALKGQRYISPALADRLARGLVVGIAPQLPHERLSSREFQIFCMLAMGQAVSCIAQTLHLSVKTVDTHRTRILNKLGMETREEIARYAFEQGLIPSRRRGDRRG